ncbi:MAG: M15 family metallopeptidase [bacterium]
MSYKIAKYKDLLSVKTKENGEDFVSVNFFASDILAKYSQLDMQNIFEGKILVRKTVAKKLADAVNKMHEIEENYTFLVSYGYRTLEIQKRYFFENFNKIKAENPKSEEGNLTELTHQLIAAPEVAGHPTGGAVDLTIYDKKNKKTIDMGGRIGDLSDKRLFTFSEGINEKQIQNRKFLHDLMVQQGFCPFYKEWWHFSYGDKEWAWFYDKKNAIYQQKTQEQIKWKM